ncbi:MAG TPA: hypothetical protein VJN02_06230 [Gammaproteobacteria bacterium]|nr:hypothetical protein [Gammaproteobacteria bacterium]
MFNHSTKKRHLEINHLPENIANFYSKITHFEYNHEQVMSILKHPSFQLNQDIPFTQEAYSPYHDHSFETPLLAICHYASQHAYDISDEELLDIIEQFVDLKANVNAKDQWQDTPLLLLSMTDNDKGPYTTSIQSLIKHGANIQETNKNGEGVLHHAYDSGHFEHAFLFTELGAPVILDKQGNSFLKSCLSGSNPLHALENPNSRKQFISTLKDTYHLLESNETVSKESDSLYEILHQHYKAIKEKNQIGSSTQSVLKEKLSHPITMTERALELILSINDRAERSEIAFKETIIQLLFEYMEKTLLESSNTVTNTSIEPITRRNNL